MKCSRRIALAAAVAALLVAGPSSAHAAPALFAKGTVQGVGGDIQWRVVGCNGPFGKWKLTLRHVGDWSGTGNAAWRFTQSKRRTPVSWSYPVAVGSSTVQYTYSGKVRLANAERSPKLLFNPKQGTAKMGPISTPYQVMDINNLRFATRKERKKYC